jgi:hypothetical protein
MFSLRLDRSAIYISKSVPQGSSKFPIQLVSYAAPYLSEDGLPRRTLDGWPEASAAALPAAA